MVRRFSDVPGYFSDDHAAVYRIIREARRQKRLRAGLGQGRVLVRVENSTGHVITVGGPSNLPVFILKRYSTCQLFLCVHDNVLRNTFYVLILTIKIKINGSYFLGYVD
jgi:hypothetical protein